MLARELADLGRSAGRRVELGEFCEESLIEPSDIYRRGSWTDLRRAAGVETEPAGSLEAELLKGLRWRLQDVDDRERLDMLHRLGRGEKVPDDARSRCVASMLGFILFNDGNAPEDVDGVLEALAAEPAIRRELVKLSAALDARARVVTRPSSLASEVPLHMHATYRRGEVLVALGDRTLGGKTGHREGVKFIKPYDADVLFVTLEKSERDYSPTTRYRDYALSRELFHWESQSSTTRRSPSGQRLIRGASTVLLFVRRTNKEPGGRAPGFVFLGPVARVTDRGERPIAFTWRLATPMPESWFAFAKAAAG